MSAEVHDTVLLPQPEPIRWRRLVAVFAVTQSMGYIAMIQAFPVLLIAMAADLGTSRTAITGAATVSTLAGALAAFPVGRLMDRHGGRLMMAGGSALGTLAVVLWSQAHSLLHLYAAFVLIGFSIAMSTYEAAFAVLVVATELRHRDGSILTVTMIAGLATYLVIPVIGWLNVEVGWRNTLLVLAALLFVTSVPSHLWAIPPRAVHLRRVQRRAGVSVGAALRQRRFWLLTVAFVGQAGAVSAVLLLLISYLIDVGQPLVVATAMPVAIGAMQILSRLALVTVARALSLTRVAALAFAIQGVGLLVLPLVGLSVPLTLLCVSAVGLGQGVGVIARPSILADTFGTAQFASILAAITVPMALARAVAPLGAAWLGDWRFLVIAGVISLVAASALVPLFGVRPIEAPLPTAA